MLSKAGAQETEWKRKDVGFLKTPLNDDENKRQGGSDSNWKSF